MNKLGNALISDELYTQYFSCDLGKCKGACCVKGDSGAPLTEKEVRILDDIFGKIRGFLRTEGAEAIEKQGTSVIDTDGDLVTPLVDGKECAYAVFENGIAFCGIEKACAAGAVSFRKPVSCHLYPVRIKHYKDFTAVNYDQWDICSPAREKGEKERIRVKDFIKEALIRKFGEKWFRSLDAASDKYTHEG